MIVTKEEHLNLCKERALKCMVGGDLMEAWSSMVSDLSKHPETAGHIAIQLGTRMIIAGRLNSQKEMKKIIEDFN